MHEYTVYAHSPLGQPFNSPKQRGGYGNVEGWGPRPAGAVTSKDETRIRMHEFEKTKIYV